MNLIKLDATPSTNLFLKELAVNQILDDFTVVVCNDQTAGRGQMGAKWDSEPDKNLTFSFLKKDILLEAKNQFQLNMVVSLAVYEALSEFLIPDIKVKWPNDIMSGNCKICGILVENFIKGSTIQKSIIGIGLNVNQTSFNGLSNVSSLKLLTGKHFNLEELLQKIMEKVKFHFQLLENEELKKLYENRLFQKDELSNFETEDNRFSGYIKGIDQTGRLIVKLDNGQLKAFVFKEVKLIY